jgi:hypothetical protein
MRSRREDWINWLMALCVAIIVGVIIYAAFFTPGVHPF